MTEQYRQYTEISLENDMLSDMISPIYPDDCQTNYSTMENSSNNTEENDNIKKIIDKTPIDACITIDFDANQDEKVKPQNVNVNGENDMSDKQKGVN